MRVRSTAVLALSTGSDRVVLAGDVCCVAAWALGRRGVARVAQERGSVVLPLHFGAGMLPVNDIASEPRIRDVASDTLRPVATGLRVGADVLVRRWVLVALGLFVASFFVGSRHSGWPHGGYSDGGSKWDIARLTVKKYAYEAYPQWRREHPTLVCPRTLRAVDGYMDHADHRDPWGRRYVFTCGSDGFYTMSLGEDGRSGTADDIWSNE